MDAKSLVQNEGVNAGSAQESTEPDEPGTAASDQVLAGGHPDDVPAPTDDLDPEDGSELLGAPGQSEPSERAGSSGQDAGSIE